VIKIHKLGKENTLEKAHTASEDARENGGGRGEEKDSDLQFLGVKVSHRET
jgi:hypothetical protein